MKATRVKIPPGICQALLLLLTVQAPICLFPLLRREGKEGHITGSTPPPFYWLVICNPRVWGFTIVDFWYIIFLTHYNEKVCGIAVLIIFHVDYFAVFCHFAVSG